MINPQTYELSNPELEIIFDPFVFLKTECVDIIFTYTVRVIGQATLPAYIDYDSNSRAIWILTSDTAFVGTHQVEVRGSIYDGTYHTAIFTL